MVRTWMRSWMSVAVFALSIPAVVVVGACGADAIGVETCRQVETARCEQAAHCGAFDLGQPVHRNSPVTDVEACTRFYHDACLHGLQSNVDPGAPATKACVAAINTGDCTIVANPEKSPACAWLVPAPVPDAGTTDAAEASAADAATADSAGQ